MSKKYYGKKAWIPSKCPDCGTKGPKPGDSFSKTMADLFRFPSGCDKLQPGFEGIDRWFTDCMQCNFNELLRWSCMDMILYSKSFIDPGKVYTSCLRNKPLTTTKV